MVRRMDRAPIAAFQHEMEATGEEVSVAVGMLLAEEKGQDHVSFCVTADGADGKYTLRMSGAALRKLRRKLAEGGQLRKA